MPTWGSFYKHKLGNDQCGPTIKIWSVPLKRKVAKSSSDKWNLDQKNTPYTWVISSFKGKRCPPLVALSEPRRAPKVGNSCKESSGIVGVDVDVLVREVSGPEDARSGALVELDGDGKLGLADVGVGRGFVELSSAAAIATDGQIAE